MVMMSLSKHGKKKVIYWAGFIIIFMIIALVVICKNRQTVSIGNSQLWNSPKEVEVFCDNQQIYKITSEVQNFTQDNFVEYSAVNYPQIDFQDDEINKEKGEKINQLLYEMAWLHYDEELEKEACAFYSCDFLVAFANKDYISIYFMEDISSGMSRVCNFEDAITISLKTGDKVSLEEFESIDTIMKKVDNYKGTIYTDWIEVEEWENNKKEFIRQWKEKEDSDYYGYYLYDGRVGILFNYYRTGRENIGLEFQGIITRLPKEEKDQIEKDYEKPQNALLPETSDEEQEEQGVESEKSETPKPETENIKDSQETVLKEYSYNLNIESNLEYEAHIHNIDLHELSELDYVPFLLVKIQEDEKKERLINRMLLRAYDSRLPINQQWMDQAEIRITYRSERYLCFEYISHAALPDGYDDTQLVFTVDLQEQKLVDYPEIETEWSRYDKFMHGSLYKEMEQWLEKPVEEQNSLRGKCSYEVYEKTAECQGISFPSVQIEGLEDQEKQEQINQLLQAPLSDLITYDKSEEEYKAHFYGSAKIYIACKSEEWLSVVYSIQMEEASKNFGDGIADIGVTVNIKTGERFMLDDFFEVERFSNWLAAAGRAGKMRTDYLLGSIMTEQEITEHYGYKIISTPLYSYRCDLCSFYIYKGKIVLLNGWSSFDVEIPLPEVYEWLKTDPWYD